MKNTTGFKAISRMIGIISITAVIGFATAALFLVGCDGISGGDAGNGNSNNNNSNNGGVGDWIAVNSPFSSPALNSISAIVYGNDRFVAVGGIKMSTSTDGINWTAETEGPFGTRGISAIAYGNGKFVISEGNTIPKMAYSSDGITWTVINNPFNTSGYIAPITYGNDKFVAAIGNKMAYSSDGVTWTYVTDADKLFSFIVNGSITTRGSISGIAFGNGKFVAGGDDGYLPNRTLKIATSSDGVTWTVVKADTFTILGQILYGNGKFVSWGENGILAYSTDGITWTDVPVTANPFYNGTSSGTINAVAYGNGKFIAVSKSMVAYSTDGATWTEEKNSTLWTAIKDDLYGTGTVRALAYGNGKFVAGNSWAHMAYLSDN